MREPRPVTLYLADIVEAAADIAEFTRGMDLDAFTADKRTRHASIACLRVIGESVKSLPEGFKGQHPDMAWQAMASTGDRLIDAYYDTSEQAVWDTITRDLPAFEEDVRDILEGLRREG